MSYTTFQGSMGVSVYREEVLDEWMTPCFTCSGQRAEQKSKQRRIRCKAGVMTKTNVTVSARRAVVPKVRGAPIKGQSFCSMDAARQTESYFQ